MLGSWSIDKTSISLVDWTAYSYPCLINVKHPFIKAQQYIRDFIPLVRN